MERLPVLTIAKENENLGQRLARIALGEAPAIVKASVPAIGTGDVTFTADRDAQVLNQNLRRRSPVGRLLELGSVPVPVNRLLPIVPEDPEPVWIDEAAAVPLARLTSTNAYTEAHKFVLMLALQRELARSDDPRALNLISSRSIWSIVRADGKVLFSTNAASAATPAGLLWNRTAIGSGSPANLSDDLEELVAVVRDGDAVAPVFIVSPRGAAFLNASGINAFRDIGILGGSIAGAPAIVTRSAAQRLILVDAAELAFSDGGVEIRRSENAAIEMVDNPGGNASTPTATQVVSAFQTNAVVLRYTRYLSWKVLQDDAVAFIELPAGGSPS
jgi:hypothetical protein